MTLPDWARAHGPSLCEAIIRSEPGDFQVTEELGWQTSGDGEHDYLWIEKTGANTEWVARQLARFADVPARDVGYAGLKDRHAVTRQWFSVPRWNSPDWKSFELEGVTVLDEQWHRKKLRRGAHSANVFRIVARVDDVACGALDNRLRRIGAQGVPNYFGEQRFGRDGANVSLADDWAAGRRLPRHKRSIAISAARSYLFNEQLDARVRAASWNRIVAGDRVNLDGSGSVFEVSEVDDDILRRCDTLDIHPAGCLCGAGARATHGGHEKSRWIEALEKARVKAGWRSMRLRVCDLEWSIADGRLTAGFSLQRGAFATAVLREIGDVIDASR